MQYNKLIRDNIPNIVTQSGRQCLTEVMGEEEYIHALRDKLVEEAQEVQTASIQELSNELADVFEVLDALIQAYGLTEADIRTVQDARRNERGSFKKRLRLRSIEA